MRHRLLLAIVALLVGSLGYAGEPRPLTPDEADMLTYLKSVGAVPMKHMCEPLTKGMPDFEARFSTWIAQNQDAIQRGRDARIAKLEDGETIERYEAGLQENLNAMLAKTPADRIAFQCLGFIASVTPRKAE